MGTAFLFLLGTVGTVGMVIGAVAGALCVGMVAGGRAGIRTVRAGQWGRPRT
ncbi:hypothetical protein ACLGIH_16570 [Streptomyces sp. HMX87]|uniref:hypothetical protein n=1 Tax=Streptomyces sp. HMX87 TaxID=3390849 RepID=UPI003A8B264C